MSSKNFMANGDAETVFSGYATRIKRSPSAFIGTRAEWDALTSAQKALYQLVNINDDNEEGGGGGSTQVQSDWTQTDDTEVDFIKHKPTLGTASAKDVASSGDAGNDEVVLGNDSRLTDSRTPSAHDQAASTITAGTLAGRVQANATAAATLANAQVRDIYIGTADMTPGTTALATGAIYLQYEA